MPRGLPASYIKKAKRELGKGASWHDIFKRAWKLYKGSKIHKAVSGNPTRKKGSRKKSSRKRSVSRMPKKKRRYSRKMTIPLAPILGVIASPGVQNAITSAMEGKFDLTMKHLTTLIGWNPWQNKWEWQHLANNLTPILVGLLVHKFVGGAPLNLNRTLARHKIPLIRI